MKTTPASWIPLLLAAAMASGAQPLTIPSLKAWKGAEGEYAFTAESRIVLGPAASDLERTARVLARDIGFQSGTAPTVVREGARAGDILLSIDAKAEVANAEGYLMDISDRVEIRSRTEAGVFYGTRTLLQLLQPRRSVARGAIRDWPDYRERGLMVDVGRKYFTVGWIKDQIVDMAYAKMNLLHLHFSDDLGIRLESVKHREIVSAQFYSKQQIQDILAIAAEYHVAIIPEIDVPGHTGWLRNAYPELILGKSEVGTYFMDITRPEARALVRDLLEEFIPLFPGPYWHMGADEYIGAANYPKYPQLESYAKAQYGPGAVGYDAYLGFIAWVHSLVKARGKTLRTWADAYEYHVLSPSSPFPLDTSIVQEPWNAFEDPKAMLASGFSLQNASFRPTYYNLGGYKGEETLLYRDWAPHTHLGGWERDGWGYPITVDSLHPKLLGAKLSVWCDNPDAESEEEVAAGIYGRLRAIAQNSWGAPKLAADFGEFRSLMDSLGRAPGYGKGPSLGLLPTRRRPTRVRKPHSHDLLGRRAVKAMLPSGISRGTPPR